MEVIDTILGKSITSGRTVFLLAVSAFIGYNASNIKAQELVNPEKDKNLVKSLHLEHALNSRGLLQLNDSDYVNIAKKYAGEGLLSENDLTIINIGSITNPIYDPTYLNELCDDIKVSTDSARYADFIRDFNDKSIRNIVNMYKKFPYKEYKEYPAETMMILNASIDIPTTYYGSYSYRIAERPEILLSELDCISYNSKSDILEIIPRIIYKNPDILKTIVGLSCTGTEKTKSFLAQIDKNRELFRERPYDFLQISANSAEYAATLLKDVCDDSSLTEVLNKSMFSGRGILSPEILTLVQNTLATDQDSRNATTTIKKLSRESLDSLQSEYAETLKKIADISLGECQFNDFTQVIVQKGDMIKVKKTLDKAEYLINKYDRMKKLVSLNKFLSYNGDVALVDSLMGISENDVKLFRIDNALDYVSVGGTYDRAMLLHEKYGMNDAQIVLYQTLGADDSLAIFKDTNKPNCVMIYPHDDYNNAFKIPDSKRLFDNINASYDLFLKTVYDEKEIYKILDSIPNIELLILGGHGLQSSMEFRNISIFYFNEFLEQSYMLDTGDKELSEHMNNLAPNARIFLYSCSNGRGREYQDNLANFVAQVSGRRVYSMTRPGNIFDVSIDNAYPLEISNRRKSRNILYIAEPKKTE